MNTRAQELIEQAANDAITMDEKTYGKGGEAQAILIHNALLARLIAELEDFKELVGKNA